MQRYGTSFNLDGIWGGNMYAGGAGAILPNKITSKHNFRYVPNMNGPGHRQEAARAARQERLQGRRGEADRRRAVGEDELRQPTIGQALKRTYEVMNIPHGELQQGMVEIGGGGAAAGGYWPAYMFGNGEVGEKISPLQGRADRRRRRRLRRPRARGQRVLRDRRRRQGLRHGGRGEGGRHADVCVRGQDSARAREADDERRN